ncbi:MAG: MtrAB system histidine kinase MtrB [Marmoricola sp.]
MTATPDRTGSPRRTPLAGVRHGFQRVLTSWRRSIRVRVVASIVVLTAVVVGSVGYLVIRQISDGLVSSLVSSSLAEAASETNGAQNRLSSAGGSDYDPQAQLRQLVEGLVSRGDVRGYDVVVLGPVGPGSKGQFAGVQSTPGIDPASVPHRLRRAVRPGKAPAWTYTRVRFDDPGRESVPGVAVGSTVVLPSDGGAYALYFVFPMTDQARTLHLIRQALLTSGLLLLALVAGVAWLVTRQVITPVRLARRVAERIASGRLEERMHVSGEDDLARLAVSFNQMADALQRQIRRLEDLSRSQRRFVSDVSHELRTPLATVRMAGDMLHDARDRFDPVAARSAELLHEELDRFETLLTDLLEISRFDAGAAALDLEQVDLVELVRRVVDGNRLLADHRGVRIDVRAAGRCVAEADPRRIERVVRNLLSNAIDHAGSPGSGIVVRLAMDADAAAVSVRDHGVGLEPGQQAMVFNRFWRADPSRARSSGGSGLGLAISLEDAHLHGGWLQAWGAPGEGALFRLTLPRRAGDSLAHSPLPLVPADAGAPAGEVRA